MGGCAVGQYSALPVIGQEGHRQRLAVIGDKRLGRLGASTLKGYMWRHLQAPRSAGGRSHTESSAWWAPSLCRADRHLSFLRADPPPSHRSAIRSWSTATIAAKASAAMSCLQIFFLTCPGDRAWFQSREHALGPGDRREFLGFPGRAQRPFSPKIRVLPVRSPP